MRKPELWLIAGPNGAGKSTIVGQHRHLLSELVPKVPFINPNEHARKLLIARGRTGFADTPLAEQKAAFIEAATALEKKIESALLDGCAIGVETVLSTLKYQRFVELTLQRQGTFGLIYVALNSPRIACRRVEHRVAHGGHDVPGEKIRERWKRSLANLPWFIRKATHAYIFDNSSDANVPPVPIARKHRGILDASLDLAFPELRTALEASV
jgi:predicted ABC-type ATPase